MEIVNKYPPRSNCQRDERFLKGNKTVQWQILETLDKAGPKGMTRTVTIFSRHIWSQAELRFTGNFGPNGRIRPPHRGARAARVR